MSVAARADSENEINMLKLHKIYEIRFTVVLILYTEHLYRLQSGKYFTVSDMKVENASDWEQLPSSLPLRYPRTSQPSPAHPLTIAMALGLRQRWHYSLTSWCHNVSVTNSKSQSNQCGNDTEVNGESNRSRWTLSTGIEIHDRHHSRSPQHQLMWIALYSSS